MAVLVGGFDRFMRRATLVRAWLTSLATDNLIAVNHLSDILENLEITFGNISVSVLIQLERWDQGRFDGRGNPSPLCNERSDHHDLDERSHNVDRRNGEEARRRHSTD